MSSSDKNQCQGQMATPGGVQAEEETKNKKSPGNETCPKMAEKSNDEEKNGVNKLLGLEIPRFRLLLFGFSFSFLSMATFGMQEVVLNLPEPLLLGMLNGSFQSQFKIGLDDAWLTSIWGVIVATMAVGAMIGSGLSMVLADYLGRKVCIIRIANILVIIGSIFMFISSHLQCFECLIMGRLVLGVSIGITTTLVPVYLVECSPQKWRGFMASLEPICYYLHISLTLILSTSQMLGQEKFLGILLAFQGIPAVLQLILSSLFPETPQYLFLKQKDPAEAVEAIKWIHGNLEAKEMNEMLEGFEAEERLSNVSLSFVEIFKIPPLRKATYLAILVGILRNATGVAVVHAYSKLLFEDAGASAGIAQYSTLMLGIGFFFAFISSLLVERIGRKPLFIGGIGWVICSWILVCVADYFPESPVAPGISLMSTLITFAVIFPMGPGAISWYLGSELVPEIARATVTSLSILALWFAYLLSVLLYPMLTASFGPASVVIQFVVPLSIGLGVLLIALPETKQRSPQEILEEIAGPNALEEIYNCLGKQTYGTFPEPDNEDKSHDKSN